MPCWRLRVEGEVHGVFFRAETKRKAEDLGVRGWVRNCDDGCVEVLARGPLEVLQQLERWCWRGPPAARVVNVTKEEMRDDPTLTAFTIVQ